jgi:hypothetical protein
MAGTPGVHRVARFVEKPSADRAVGYIAAGDYLGQRPVPDARRRLSRGAERLEPAIAADVMRPSSIAAAISISAPRRSAFQHGAQQVDRLRRHGADRPRGGGADGGRARLATSARGTASGKWPSATGPAMPFRAMSRRSRAGSYIRATAA